MQIIDSHHHIWNPSVGDFSWMTAAHHPINREFTCDDLVPLLKKANVKKTVLVQTWGSIEETENFLTLAGQTPFIAGVVGWVDFTENVTAQIDRLMAHPDARYLKGLRHQVHDEPDPQWLVDPRVLNGLGLLKRYGLVYDLLIRPREISAAIACVAQLPEQKFVVDHIAKPKIADGWDKDWDEAITTLAYYRQNVWVKLSGLVTEADWDTWSVTDIAPYVQRVIELFGSRRVMFGSDWPVCTLAADYSSTIDLIQRCISSYSKDEQAHIMAYSAIDAYDLVR